MPNEFLFLKTQLVQYLKSIKRKQVFAFIFQSQRMIEEMQSTNNETRDSQSQGRLAEQNKFFSHLADEGLFNQSVVELTNLPVIFLDESFRLLHCKGDVLEKIQFQIDLHDKNFMNWIHEASQESFKMAVTKLSTSKSVLLEKLKAKGDDKTEFRFLLHKAAQFKDRDVFMLELLSVNSVDRGFGLRPDNVDLQDLDRLKELSNEVEKIKDSLHSEIDTLKSVNKEFQLVNNEYIEKNKELQSMNESLTQFSYSASHDLQEPLRTVRSFSSLLQAEYKGKLSEEADVYLNFIQDSVERMQNLIVKILDFSNLGKKLKFESVDINEVVGDYLLDQKQFIQDSQAEISQGYLPTIEGSKIELMSLFNNLINNAIKFTAKDQHPQVRLDSVDLGDEVIIKVSDKGIGIAKDDQKIVFEAFKRLNHSSDYPGTGIGLATVKRVVELHHGKVWVESEHGMGTTFYIQIPKKMNK